MSEYRDSASEADGEENFCGATSSESLEVVLQPAEGVGPPSLLADILAELQKALPPTVRTGTGWLRSKGEQEWAKAYQIKAQVLESVGKLDIERQRMVEERKKADREFELQLRASDREEKKLEFAHKEREFALYTARLRAIAEVISALSHLKEKGADVDLSVVYSQLWSLGATPQSSVSEAIE